MAELQYIGARYVPKFFEGVNGSNWVANTQYEALTIVTRNGNSYTSKIPVPASVGAPENNPTYWVSTGSFNQQVESYRQEVEEYKAVVDENIPLIASGSPLFNSRTVVYGDSTTAVEGNYIQALIDNYNLDIVNRSASGIGIEYATTLISNATDLMLFNNIILAFGTNHWQGNLTLEANETNYRNAFSAIYAKNPKINIICITPFWSYHKFGNNPVNVNNRGYKLSDYVESIKKVCREYGIPVIDFYTTSGCNQSNYTQLLVPSISDPSIYVHESAEFGRKLADLVLLGNYSDNSYTPNEKNYISCLTFGTCLLSINNYSNLPAQARGGICLALQPNTNNISAMMYLKADTYVLSGYSTGNTTVTLLKGTTEYATYSIQEGYFKIPLEPDVSSAWYIKFNNTALTYIGMLKLYSATNNDSINNIYQLGYAFSATNLISGGLTPYVIGDEFTVTWSDGYFTPAQNITAGNDSIIFTTPDIYFPVRLIVPTTTSYTVGGATRNILVSFYHHDITIAEGSVNAGEVYRIPGGTKLMRP